MKLTEKLFLLLVVLCGLIVFIYNAISYDKDVESFWNSKYEITEIGSNAFPINVKSVYNRRGALIINDSFTIIKQFSAGRDTIGFHDFLEKGDSFSYFEIENKIEVYRNDKTYIFPRYFEPID